MMFQFPCYKQTAPPGLCSFMSRGIRTVMARSHALRGNATGRTLCVKAVAVINVQTVGMYTVLERDAERHTTAFPRRAWERGVTQGFSPDGPRHYAPRAGSHTRNACACARRNRDELPFAPTSTVHCLCFGGQRPPFHSRNRDGCATSLNFLYVKLPPFAGARRLLLHLVYRRPLLLRVINILVFVLFS